MHASEVLKVNSVSEADLQAILDVAGEVLREHSLFWLGSDPHLGASDDALLYQFCIAVDPQTASALTDEVLDRVISRDLDRPGLLFSFLGTQIDGNRSC